ncbi:MAG: YcxB family protein, partial [Methylococcales bacterium]|nr:YcxB family protein [Methylococcales bacterium]
MYEIEYEFREEDLVHFNEMRLKNDPEMQKNIRKSKLLVPGAMLLIGMFYYLYYADMKTTAYIAVLALAWGIISPYVMKMDMRRQFLEKYTEKEKADLFGIHTLKIEQDHLAEKSPGGKHRTLWKDMLRVDYVDKYVHIFLDLDSAIVIPVETIKSGDLEKFSDQVEKMI